MADEKKTTPAKLKTVNYTCFDGFCKSKGTYTLDVSCYNCGTAFRVKLTKGHDHIGARPECPGCGVASCTSWGKLVTERSA